jgi:hypothetical protein
MELLLLGRGNAPNDQNLQSPEITVQLMLLMEDIRVTYI